MGADKANLWLQRNHDRLKIPIRAQLGATLNFQAGTTKRAPVRMQKSGLEWLWRIKEEPRLWRRYLADGVVLGQLMLTHVIPLLIVLSNGTACAGGKSTTSKSTGPRAEFGLISHFRRRNHAEPSESRPLICKMRRRRRKNVVINLAGTRRIDARFIGSLLVLHKRLKEQQLRMQLTVSAPPRQTAVPPEWIYLFALNV